MWLWNIIQYIIMGKLLQFPMNRVVRNIPDNMKVMGYPAKNIREFLRDNK